jgi:uncharacterized protein YbjT (DUF2867 family)
VTYLRPNSFLQDLASFFASTIASQGTFFAPMADAPVSFVDARDVGRVAAKVLTEDGHEGRIYDLTGPEAITYTQVAQRMSTIFGKPVRYVALSDEAAKQALGAVGLPGWFVDAFLSLCHFYRQGGGSLTTEWIKILTGTNPCTLDTYLKENIATFRDSNADGIPSR